MAVNENQRRSGAEASQINARAKSKIEIPIDTGGKVGVCGCARGSAPEILGKGLNKVLRCRVAAVFDLSAIQRTYWCTHGGCSGDSCPGDDNLFEPGRFLLRISFLLFGLVYGRRPSSSLNHLSNAKRLLR